MLVQAGLCQTCSETTLLVFPRGSSYVSVVFVAFHPVIVGQYGHLVKIVTISDYCSDNKTMCVKYLSVHQSLVTVDAIVQPDFSACPNPDNIIYCVVTRSYNIQYKVTVSEQIK